MNTTASAPLDRVAERQRAVTLARHYRDAEGLSIAQIARQLGRSPAAVKAYLYDPSDANKRPADSTQERQCWALAGPARTSICKPLLDSSLRRHEAGVPHCPICPVAAAAQGVVDVKIAAASRDERQPS